jgi:hypothetical protein
MYLGGRKCLESARRDIRHFRALPGTRRQKIVSVRNRLDAAFHGLLAVGRSRAVRRVCVVIA